MSDGSWIFVAIGLALVTAALAYGFASGRDTQRRVTGLEAERFQLQADRLDDQLERRELTSALAEQKKRIDQLEARPDPSKHTSVALAQTSTADAWLSEAGKVLDQLDVFRAQAENSMLKAEWVRHGGKPDAPWSQIVKWNTKGKPS